MCICIRIRICIRICRYAAWVVEQNAPDAVLRPLIEKLMERILDHNKKVRWW